MNHEKLEISNKELRRMLETIQDIIFQLTPTGYIKWVSPNVEDLYGYKPKDLVGKHLKKTTPTGEVPKVIKTLKEVLSGKPIEGFELNQLDSEGNVIPMEINLTPVKKEGKIIAVHGVMRNIAERKQAKDVLRESEERYRAVFENTGAATIIIEEDTTISLANREFERLSGFSKREIEGKKSWTEFVVKKDLKKMKKYHRKRRVDPEAAPRQYQFQFTDRDNNIKDILLTIDMIPETKRSVASLLDITRQKRIEEKLQAVEELSRQMKLATGKEEIYGLVMDCVKDVLGYYNCAIFELKKDYLEFVQERGWVFRSVGDQYPLDGKGITVAAFNNGQPLYVPDVREDERYIEGNPKTRCEYAVPIVINQDKYGLLDVQNDTLDSVSIDDQNLIQILVSEMAVALKGLERLEKIEGSRAKLEELHDAVDRLQGCEMEEEIYEVTVDAAEKILGFELCAIGIVKEDLIVPKATSAGLSSDDTMVCHVGEAIVGKTVERGKTIAGDVRDFSKAKPTRDDFRAFISTPIGELGVFQVVSTKVGAFTQDDVKLAEILANHLLEEIKRIRLEEELKRQAIHDPLTGLYNRRYFNQTIEKEIEQVKRYDHPLSFLMIDIDDFKEVNDRYSHLTGDNVLREVADLLTRNVREADTAVRYGGDEFLIILPETNSGVSQVKNRIMDELKQWNQENNLIDFPLTLSMGASCLSPEEDRDIEEVLKEADRKMYEDKVGR